MPRRLIPTMLTFVVLVSCYLAYDTLVLPALQGPPAPPVEVVKPQQAQVQESAQLFGELIAPIFPEGSWERSCDIVLRNEQILLFVGGYEQLDDHRLQISPCTIVLRPQGFESATGPDNRTWIMQAPDKTILQMEHDADIRRGSLGRIVSAYIPGEVKIRCEETEPGAGDQIELATTHVQISAQQIWTPHDVRFRWGANFGVGTDLTIRFSDLQSSRGRLDRLPQALPAGLRSIELVRLERLHIESPSGQRGRADGPVEVTCGGTLKLDMLGGLARMSQDVKIERFAPGGQVDKLQCDELTARFSSARRPGRSDQTLQFERVVATGQPATVTSRAVTPSSTAVATNANRSTPPQHHFAAARMEYDLLSGEFLTGPGQYSTQINHSPAAGQPDEFQAVDVTWQKSMRWQNAQAGKLLTLNGSARCSFGPNQILCNRLRMWFDQDVMPRVAPRVALATQPARPSGRSASPGSVASAPSPRRVIADGHVQINTLALVGSTERLDVVLQSPSETPGPMVSPAQQHGSDSLQLRPPGNNSSGSRRSAAGANRLRVYGQTMRLMVERAGSELQLRDVNIDGNVLCSTEDESGRGDRPRIELEGTTLLIRDLDATAGVATIAGAPAKIRGRGMDISGPTINLDRAGNRMWIDGAGSATLPLPRTIAARYPRDAAFAYVVWQNGMSFDGQTIRCAQNVHIRGPAQMIRAAQLEVTLNRPIDFSRTHIQDADVDLQRITADGGVTIENRTLSARGLESIDSAAVETFTIAYPSGQVIGQGPGWIETVRMGKNIGAMGKPAAAADSLIYLRVEFQRQMRANLTQPQAEFSDRIQGTFGPVKDWKDRIEARDAATLAAGQLLMNCDRLTLFQIKNSRPGKAPVELVAEGNATIEGHQFKASANRMSYDQGKDSFLMVGAPRAPARLWRQTRPGAPRAETEANTIQYSPSSGALRMEGMRMLDWITSVRS